MGNEVLLLKFYGELFFEIEYDFGKFRVHEFVAHFNHVINIYIKVFFHGVTFDWCRFCTFLNLAQLKVS